MTGKRLLEDLPDRRRICVMLRADGWSYEEIATFLDIGVRLVRSELEQAADSFPGMLDHRRTDNRNRLLRLVYLMGVSDGGGGEDAYTDHLDGLVSRATWLRTRMRAHDEMRRSLRDRKRLALGIEDEESGA